MHVKVKNPKESGGKTIIDVVPVTVESGESLTAQLFLKDFGSSMPNKSAMSAFWTAGAQTSGVTKLADQTFTGQDLQWEADPIATGKYYAVRLDLVIPTEEGQPVQLHERLMLVFLTTPPAGSTDWELKKVTGYAGKLVKDVAGNGDYFMMDQGDTGYPQAAQFVLPNGADAMGSLWSGSVANIPQEYAGKLVFAADGINGDATLTRIINGDTEAPIYLLTGTNTKKYWIASTTVATYCEFALAMAEDKTPAEMSEYTDGPAIVYEATNLAGAQPASLPQS